MLRIISAICPVIISFVAGAGLFLPANADDREGGNQLAARITALEERQDTIDVDAFQEQFELLQADIDRLFEEISSKALGASAVLERLSEAEALLDDVKALRIEQDEIWLKVNHAHTLAHENQRQLSQSRP